MIAKGAPVADVDAARAFYTAHPSLIQPTAEGVIAQDELSRQLDQVSNMTNAIKGKTQEWQNYIQKANTTLTAAEQARVEEARKVASAETAIKALAQQYNISEEDVKALYNPSATTTIATSTAPANLNPNNNLGEGDRTRVTQLNNQNTVSREDLVGLINDIGKKDELNARHFELTGKPWNSSKALTYIKEQAALGRQVDIEQAWRVTENIDSIEATKATADEQAKEVVMEAKIREKIALENTTPLDAAPQFSETKLASIFSVADPADPNAVKERTGHNGRTREAVAALQRLQHARATGQKSPYAVTNQS